MTIKEKLKLYLKSKRISPTAAERKLGWGVGALTKAKSITSDRAKDFLHCFDDLSAEWVFRDEGEMLLSPHASDYEDPQTRTKPEPNQNQTKTKPEPNQNQNKT